MNTFRILQIKQSVYEGNDKRAQELREELRAKGVFLLNLMSSPGSGKTSTILKTIKELRNRLRIGVMEADIDSDVDACTVANTGTKVIQLHTGGMCHLDAAMTGQGIAGLGTEDLDLIILENVGNLICTAQFATGASKNAMILSVPEGDDKPLKYPIMFEMADALLINKIDTCSLFNFNFEAFEVRVRKLNPLIKIFPISAKTGEGIFAWTDWLYQEVQVWKNNNHKE